MDAGVGEGREGAPELRREPGTYLLIFRLPEPVRILPGRLGAFEVGPGTLVYVGSALGPGGVGARVGRHLRAGSRAKGVRAHWHVDALLARAPVREAVVRYGRERLEHRWAGLLLEAPGASAPVPGFGSSDCVCPSHLVALPGPGLPPALLDRVERVPQRR